jgi:hypothetical protein
LLALCAAFFFLWLRAAGGAGPAVLTVAQAGPSGEIAALGEAHEIRVVFSQPMVVLGRIPEPVAAPFFRISPPVGGSFRWSGTTTLIFTPSGALPFATRFTVAIASSAASISGARLAEPFSFTFTTPTVRLLRTEWYRKSGRFDSPLVLALRFNQPVKPETAAGFVTLRFQSHPWTPPEPPLTDEKGEFKKKVAVALASAARSDAVAFTLGREWNFKRWPRSEDLVVLETSVVPAPQSWLEVWVGAEIRGAEGREPPGKAQNFTVKLEPAFFVLGLGCSRGCDPDSYNPLNLALPVKLSSLRSAIRVTDSTDPLKPRTMSPGKIKSRADGGDESPESAEEAGDDEISYDDSSSVALEDFGFAFSPARTYAIAVDRDLRSLDGQTLGYTWRGSVENWHRTAFASFGTGHGVWESEGGPQVPFSVRNLQSVTQWLSPVSLENLMPVVRSLEESGFRSRPPSSPVERRLSPSADRIQAYGLDLKPVLSGAGTGLAWAELAPGNPISRSRFGEREGASTLLQVTNLGISVKDSPQNTLIFVTRLDDARPVEGAKVSIRTLENKIFWSGTTDARGIAIARETDLRDHRDWWKFRFLVSAEKDGDIAYVCSHWNEGVSPWEFSVSYDLDETRPLLRGKVFSDRGVYKLGEEVHVKAILRADTVAGMKLLKPDERIDFLLKDSHDQEVAKSSVAAGAWSAAQWVFQIPEGGPLGNYVVTAKSAGTEREVAGLFLVAAYRRPDFRVDVNLSGDSAVAGVRLKGTVAGRYLFGSPMTGRPVRWTYSKSSFAAVPNAILDRFPEDQYVFSDEEFKWRQLSQPPIASREEVLSKDGKLDLDLSTEISAGHPYQYELEGEVTDVSRQKIAGRASFTVHPAPWYVGVKRPPFFADAGKGLDTEILAASLAGPPEPGVKVQVTLTQIQWNSVRRAEGNGFYTWETKRKEVASGSWEVETKSVAAALHVDVPSGGYFVLRAEASDDHGHKTSTATSFYAIGEGYTAWERYDHNRIDLLPEKKSYKPGETARILIKSPWEKATALLTTEREGVRTERVFTLSSTQETVTVPVTEEDIPNVYVSVLLVKGRTEGFTAKDASDPGKPSFRLGYAELRVEDARKRLSVSVRSDRDEYRPAAKMKVEIAVTDAEKKPAAAELTLWAVDYGVLSLTGYRTPDLLSSVWVAKALQVANEDSRQRIVSRRVLTPKGASEGGGGGAEEGPGNPVRKDFRVLAFWLGSVVTDAEGRASEQVKLPESLTTYRIMAVASDVKSRFGWGEREIHTVKPVLLKSAFPRFLALGDRAFFGSVVFSQLKEKGTAIVSMRSLDPTVLEIAGPRSRSVDVAAKGSAEVRFDVTTRAVGRARIETRVKLLGESDAFEETLPIEILASPETTAAYGEANPKASEAVQLPAGVVTSFGGLHVELSSTAMVGLGEGARYLIEYPYGCAEQRASRTLALLLAADLGDAFTLPGIDPAHLKEVVQSNLKELEAFQCPDGGFSFWKGYCWSSSPYLTSYVLHVFQRAQNLHYSVNAPLMDRAGAYLEGELGKPAPTNEGWWPGYTAWQAFAVKVLSEGGRNVDSHVNRIAGYVDRMPVFALAYLSDAIRARGETGKRPSDLLRRIHNAILPEGGTAHVEELADPYLLWFWNSNVRSTAIALGTLVRGGSDDALIAGLVRWLMKVRREGRWGNTQENALAMEALVDYYRKFESEVPDFSAVVALGSEEIDRQHFQGRSTEVKAKELPMRELLGKGKPGERFDLTFEKNGAGKLFYSARLRYAADEFYQQGLDNGMAIERRYSTRTAGGAGSESFQAGELVTVTLRFHLTKERRFVAVTDPLPAGLEPVESWFATTASALSREAGTSDDGETDWTAWWRRGGFDYVERHDDRVLLFATRLSEGDHEFSYVARATTAGSFRTAPAHAEEMYEPEVFGRTGTSLIEVKP